MHLLAALEECTRLGTDRPSCMLPVFSRREQGEINLGGIKMLIAELYMEGNFCVFYHSRNFDTVLLPAISTGLDRAHVLPTTLFIANYKTSQMSGKIPVSLSLKLPDVPSSESQLFRH